MKILIVNKFLFQKGGAETYILQLGDHLKMLGHEVQYFGMDHEKRCVGNTANAYTSHMDFHTDSMRSKLTYSVKTIYSIQARNKIRLVLEDFQPDVVHLNNINFQLTPAIIYEIKKFGIPIVQTVHDSQMACPSHNMYIEHKRISCQACLESKNYFHCIRNKCVHNSTLKSFIAAIEAFYYHARGTYRMVDAYISPSRFMADIVMQTGVREDTVHVLPNPIDTLPSTGVEKSERYILYFGRLSREKGIQTLLNAATLLPDIPIVVAGSGPLEQAIQADRHIRFVGFKQDDELRRLVGGAVCSVLPAEWSENCPFSVLESQALGVPVIGSDMGGIPELIEDGETGFIFRAGDTEALAEKIRLLWDRPWMVAQMKEKCLTKPYITWNGYISKLLDIYRMVEAGESICKKQAKGFH